MPKFERLHKIAGKIQIKASTPKDEGLADKHALAHQHTKFIENCSIEIICPMFLSAGTLLIKASGITILNVQIIITT
jgi:hypothetical protein